MTTLVLAAEAGGGAAAPVDVLALLGVLLAAWGAGWVATRLGYPAVLGELLAGILIGPPVLGLISDAAGLEVVAELGVLLMMVWIGTELDLDNLRKASKAGLYAAIGGFVVPFAGGLLVMRLFGFDWIAAVFVGAAVGVTSLATKSRILADLGLFDTRIAYVLMVGALVADTSTLVVFAGILSFGAEDGGGGVAATASVLAQAVAFFAIAAGAAAVMPRIGAWLRDRIGLDGSGFGLSVLVALGLAGGALAEVFGMHAILGAFVAGMVATRGLLPSRTERESAELLERLSVGLLAPVFFFIAGFDIDLAAIVENPALVITVIVVATLGKVLGTTLAYLPTGNGWREGIVVGAAMNGRGAVEIIVAGIGVDLGLITTEVFTVLVVMAVVTTATVPVMLTMGVRWLRDRGELDDVSRRRGVLIIGAGALARVWAEKLDGRGQVTLLDRNQHRVRQARAAGLHAVEGDATDVDALFDAGVADVGAVIALTPNFEVNLLACKLAREEYGIRDVRMATGPAPHDSAAGLLERYQVRPLSEDPVDVDHWSALLSTDDAVTREVELDGSHDLEATTYFLSSGRGGLPLTVRRGGDVMLFPPDDGLRVGDEVTVAVRSGEPSEAEAMLPTG